MVVSQTEEVHILWVPQIFIEVVIAAKTQACLPILRMHPGKDWRDVPSIRHGNDTFTWIQLLYFHSFLLMGNIAAGHRNLLSDCPGTRRLCVSSRNKF